MRRESNAGRDAGGLVSRSHRARELLLLLPVHHVARGQSPACRWCLWAAWWGVPGLRAPRRDGDCRLRSGDA